MQGAAGFVKQDKERCEERRKPFGRFGVSVHGIAKYCESTADRDALRYVN
jgi:hypothetical protein